MRKSTGWLYISAFLIICNTQLKKGDQKIYLLNQLKKNKGMVSSALGIKLAKDFLSGKKEILDDALKLIHFDDKNVRSGATKIIETIAEEKPDLISNFLADLLRCLEYPEAQTRWMILHIAGLCDQYQPEVSRKIFQEAVKYLHKKHGTVLNDRAILYFGYMGSVSKEDCDNCFPYLIDCFSIHPNRITRIFESLERLSHHMDADQKKIYNTYIKKYLTSSKPSVKRWANKARKIHFLKTDNNSILFLMLLVGGLGKRFSIMSHLLVTITFWIIAYCFFLLFVFMDNKVIEKIRIWK